MVDNLYEYAARDRVMSMRERNSTNIFVGDSDDTCN